MLAVANLVDFCGMFFDFLENDEQKLQNLCFLLDVIILVRFNDTKNSEEFQRRNLLSSFRLLFIVAVRGGFEI